MRRLVSRVRLSATCSFPLMHAGFCTRVASSWNWPRRNVCYDGRELKKQRGKWTCTECWKSFERKDYSKWLNIRSKPKANGKQTVHAWSLAALQSLRTCAKCRHVTRNVCHPRQGPKRAGRKFEDGKGILGPPSRGQLGRHVMIDELGNVQVCNARFNSVPSRTECRMSLAEFTAKLGLLAGCSFPLMHARLCTRLASSWSRPGRAGSSCMSAWSTTSGGTVVAFPVGEVRFTHEGSRQGRPPPKTANRRRYVLSK